MLNKIVISIFLSVFVLANCNNFGVFKKWGGHYYTITTKRVTFNTAKALAEQMGGYLAIPNSLSENKFLTSMVRGGQYAWIGVYDPNLASNYCYAGGNCVYDDSRFVDIKGNPLTYTNWAYHQPDNFVKTYDVHKGEQLVAPLGEHWVALGSPSGEWGDFGNHADEYNNPVKFYALIEFDNQPECYTPPSNVSDEIQGVKCNTMIYDSKIDTLKKGKTFDCQTDKYGTKYCPSGLAECGQDWDYADSEVVEHIGVVKDYANGGCEQGQVVESKCLIIGSSNLQTSVAIHQTHYPSIMLGNYTAKIGIQIENGKIRYFWIGLYNNDPNSAHSFFYYGKWIDIVSPKLQTSQVSMVTNISGIGSFEVIKGIQTEKGKIRYFVYTKDYNNNEKGSYGRWIDIFSKSLQTSNFQTQLSNTGIQIKNGMIRFFDQDYYQYSPAYGKWINLVTTKEISCPTGYSLDDQGRCFRKLSYSYYEYKCKHDPNDYGNDYEPIDNGMTECSKTDPDQNNPNPELADSCNSDTPPANNCKRKKFVCKEAPNRKCAWVDNKWQCSPFPCIGSGDIEEIGVPVGANDANNNGWNNDGSCSGQIYIFNGQDKRCRSDDIFFGLLGGGCCKKDDVFFGLVECKEDEKKLAKMRNQDRCHYIGEYCSKKIKLIGLCIQHKKTYCCFNSKLARIINEQGRQQLKKGWGSAKSPNCRGFTPEEFQKLDFSKINLSEFFNDVTKNVSQSVIQKSTQYIKNSIQSQLGNI